MSKKKKNLRRHLNPPLPKTASEPDTYIYLLINESPRYIYSTEFSKVYDLLLNLFGTEPILEEDAINALFWSGFISDPVTVLRRMVGYDYLRRISLRELMDDNLMPKRRRR